MKFFKKVPVTKDEAQPKSDAFDPATADEKYRVTMPKQWAKFEMQAIKTGPRPMASYPPMPEVQA
jgi:hypothetical protein